MRESIRRDRVKLLIVTFAVLIAFVGSYRIGRPEMQVSAASSGPSASHTDAPGEDNCTACHTSFPVNSGTGGITIAGIPANYRPNQVIPITVTTSQADQVIYGFQMTVIDRTGKFVGDYTLPTQNPAQMQTINGIVGGQSRRYVEHTSDGLIPVQFGSKTWTFNWKAPSTRVGKLRFYAAGNAANSDGGPGDDYIYTKSTASLTGTAVSSFDGDGVSDLAVWRPNGGVWYSLNSTNGGFVTFPFGASGDKIVPGDYDGDGKTDYAVFRPSEGVWYIWRSSATPTFYGVGFGLASDIPVQGDFDGDLKTDIAVWRPTGGVWYLLQSTAGSEVRNFGLSTDKPFVGDFDGDGKTDLGAYRPSTGVWYIQQSTLGFSAIRFGSAEDRPVPGDYDGDGKTDIALYRPSTGTWYLQQSTAGFYGINFGLSSDTCSPADLDGDGRTDIAVWRPSEGNWYAIRSSNSSLLVTHFGSNGDVPVSSGYNP